MNRSDKTKRSTGGWTRLVAGEHAATLSKDTVSVSATVRLSGSRAGERRIYTQNPDKSWTVVVINAAGDVVDSAHGTTQREARQALQEGS